ncbi:MAG: ribosome maturation factor RimM [Cyclonatronaceae bacterium]
MTKDSNYNTAGRIIRVHGTAGMVVFESESVIPETGNLFLVEQSEGDMRPYRAEKASPAGKAGRHLFFLKFVDIDNRSAAEALKGFRVFENPGSAYSRIPADEPAGTDLTGYTVTDAGSRLEGYVSEVIDNPAHPLLQVQFDSALILVPLVDAYITGIDHKNSRITARNLEMFTDL